MDPTRRWSHRFSNIFEKSDNVMVCPLFDFQDSRDRKSRAFPNFGSVLLWNLPELRHRLTGEHLDFEPDLELTVIRPDLAHLRPGITIDHRRNIKGTDLREKCFLLTRRLYCALFSAHCSQAKK